MIPRYHTGGHSSMGRTYTQNIQNLSKNYLLGQKKMECTICSDKMLLSSGTEMEKGIVAGWQLREDKEQSQHMWNISHWHQQENNSAKSAIMRPWGLTLWPLLVLFFFFGYCSLMLTSCQVPYQKLQEGKTHAWYIGASEDRFLSTNNPLLLFPKVVSLKQLWIIRFMLLKKNVSLPSSPRAA